MLHSVRPLGTLWKFLSLYRAPSPKGLPWTPRPTTCSRGGSFGIVASGPPARKPWQDCCEGNRSTTIPINRWEAGPKLQLPDSDATDEGAS